MKSDADPALKARARSIPNGRNGKGDSGREPCGQGLRAIERAIAAHYDRLSPGQRRAIDRLLADTRYGAVVSAPALAVEVGISESTVTRAAQALGFAGFPHLQAHLRSSFFDPVQDRVEAEAARLGDPDEIAVRVMLEDATSIRETAEDLSLPAFHATIDALVSARRVLVFGERGSHGLVIMLGIGLRLLLPDVRLLSQAAGDLPDQLVGLSRGDALVAISFRRVDRTTVKVLKNARERGAQTIAMTDHLSSPAARAADLTLIARLGNLRLMPSFAPGASLVNAILAETSVRTHHHVSPRLREAEALWTEFEAYAES